MNHAFHLASVPHLKLIIAAAIFLGSYVVFALGKFPGMKIDRPGAAIIGAVLMVALRVVPAQEIVRLIDFKTIVLLFSMMVIVGYLRLAGFFDWVTEIVLARLKPRHLLPAVIFVSGLLSAFFVNDIICLAMVPFVLATTRRAGVKPLPYLLAIATASNVGSVATITGNPQNMLIGLYSGMGYRWFLFHLAPIAVAGLLLCWAVFHWTFFRGENENCAPELRAAEVRVDRSRLIKPGIVVGCILAGFLAGAPPALVAALGVAVMLITRTHDPAAVYRQVDWGVLVFFVGLFVIVGGAELSGLLGLLLHAVKSPGFQSVGAFTLLVAILSNIVSNVPAVMLLKSTVAGFAHPHTGWLVLAMASTLAGNLTITGSVANIIVIERARPEVEISFRDYFRVGLPITALTLIFGGCWLWWIR